MQNSHRPLNALQRFTPAASRTHALPSVPVDELPVWMITRSYFEAEQHVGDHQRHTLARRLGCEASTARKWLRAQWSTVTLSMVDREDIADELASGRSYYSIAEELCVDDLALRKWVRADPEMLRVAEEYRAEMLLDRAKQAVNNASDIGSAKAASTLLTHAQWAAERMYRTKFRPNAEAPIIPMSFNFDLGPASGTTINRTAAQVQSGPDAVHTLFNT